MEDRFHRSFRMKNLVYGLYSLIFSMITVLLFVVIICGFHQVFQPKPSTTPQFEDGSSSNRLSNNYNYLLDNGSEMNSLTNKVENNKMGTGFIATVTVLAIVIGFVSYSAYFMLFTRKFSDYLSEISNGIKELSAGNFATTIPLREDDELTQIAKSLNLMAKEIEQIINLERSTEYKKNELITNVAHDLRTPLTSIIGYLEIVSNRELSLEDRNKYTKIAFDKSKRLEKLIEDLFTYTKLEFGQIALHLQSVDMVKMMGQMLEEFYPSFCDNGLQYEFRSTEKSVIVEADGDLLARAFENLIGNAIKYGRDGKNVDVSIDTKPNTVIISIVNFGEIIPKKDIDKIFEKFYRVDNSRNDERGGTGLGLAIAKNIITMHNGQISARSSLDGTVFEVILNREELNETMD